MRSVLRRGVTPNATAGKRAANSIRIASSQLSSSSTAGIVVGASAVGHRTTTTATSLIVEQRRLCASSSNGINPDEISFVEEIDADGANGGEASTSSAGGGAGGGGGGRQSKDGLPFEDAPTIDPFSRARVVNFVKRYNSKLQSTHTSALSTNVANADDKLFEVVPIRHADAALGIEETIYHARVRLPFPQAEYGDIYGEGLGMSAKDAEVLAAMHAEYIIDALGFQIYTLGSMQKKHAEAARRAGRWAPMPEEGLRDLSTITSLPPRLRRIANRDESEGGKYTLVDPRPLPFASPSHTMLSPAIFDPSALVRLKNYFALQNASFDVALRFEEVPPIDKADPLFYEASIALEPLISAQLRGITSSSSTSVSASSAIPASSYTALGKGTDRNIALILAAMHAEMLIDAFGGALHPTDTAAQAAHARTVRGYGRAVRFIDEPAPAAESVSIPKALKLLVGGGAAANSNTSDGGNGGRPRVCPRSAEEDFVHRHVLLAEGTTAFTNVEQKQMDGMAQHYLGKYLAEANSNPATPYPRHQSPFLREKVGTQWRSTVVLPLPSSYGIRGGVGLAESEHDADRLAAMHALEVLVMLNIPISTSDPIAQSAFVEKRAADGRAPYPSSSSSAEGIDRSAPSPPGLRRVTVSTMARPQPAAPAAASSSIPQVSAAAAASSSSAPPPPPEDDPCDPLPHRETTPKSYWDLEADSSDGFIIVKSHGDPNEPPAKLFGHTLSCVRRIDPMAKNRIINYLAFLGKRPTNTFNFQRLPSGRDGFSPHRCVIRLPVPAEVGDRIAVGEGPELRDAEILACMHAELILDTIGVPLYPDASQQQKHATAATSVGRYAPYPGDPLQEKETPSPPPLRMIRDPALGNRNAGVVSTPKGGRINPYTDAAKAAATAKAAAESAQSVAKEAAAIASRRAGIKLEPIVIPEADIDQNSRQRVNNYFRRTVKALPEPTNTVEVKGSVSAHQSRMWVPVPNKFGERYAIGTADKKKDADSLCYMHAERIIDALGLHLFNLPGLQRRHAERVRKEGRWAPMPGELLNKPDDTPSPASLRSGASVGATIAAARASVPTPSDMALQDFTAWGMFVGECEEFIEVALRKYENDCYEKDHVPLTGDVFIDGAISDVQTLQTDVHAKSILTNYLTMTNQAYPSLWRSRAVGPVQNRKCLTMVEVPGHRHLTALGVSSSKEVSQRRAAMHMLAIFKRLDPNFHMTMSQDFSASMPRGRDGEMIDGRGKTLSSKMIAQREAAVGSWDATANAFTNDGKVRIIELFTVCNALPPPFVHQKQRTEGGYTHSMTYVEVTDEDGMKHVGQAEDNGPRRNETGAYNDLFINMSRTVPSFQSLMQLVRTHPHLAPDQIVDMSLPPAISERIEKLVDGVDEDTIADAAMPTVSVDVTTEDLVQQQSDTSNPVEKERRLVELQRKAAEKAASQEYKDKYQSRRESLSIWDKKEEIMDIISKNQVTVVCGTTGCGKTTQLPQYILDWETERGTAGDCNIVVTQPRRISATSISQRIADERLERIGDSVGYTIRLDSIPGKHINLCTSGVLLRIFQANPNLDGIRYVIIDEIHERDINSDFLLILMRELLQKRPDLRLILMSATLQSELFSGFFGRAPVVNVEGYVYPVQELFLEDLAKHAIEKKEAAAIPSFKDFVEAAADGNAMQLSAPEGESMVKFRARGGAGAATNPRPRYGFMECHTDIDYTAVDYAIRHIIKFNDMNASSILVFLPGWDEIVRCRDVLEKNPKYHLLLMHSTVNNEDQLQCFKPAPEGKIKIILSTNIAESGVTIDDIRGVVDVGRAKEKSFVLRKGRTAVGRNDMGTLSQLVTVYASRANCIQRRGRAGRTRPGMCIRLYTKDHFESVADFQTPEMLRQPLDSLCLQILALSLGDPSAFLNKALEPPSAEAVETSMRRLESLGATTPTRQLTHLGLALSKLPVAPRTGKVILLGCIFKCLDSALTIASTVENEVFNASRDAREATKINRDHMTFASLSDHLASVNGFNSWSEKVAEPNIAVNDVMAYINEHSLFIPALRNVSRYKRQFMDILAQSKFVEERPPKFQVYADESDHSRYATDCGLVKSVIAAGLFPNIAMYRGKRTLRAKHDNSINIANSSTLFRAPPEDIKSPFFCFEELMRTSEANGRIQCRTMTNVSIWAVLLLGASNSQLAYRDDLNLGLIDDWIVFRANFTDLDLIKRFKAMLAKAIVKKLTDPTDYDNNATLEVLRDIVRDLVNSPIRPNNLVEETWEDAGTITRARASLIDPILVLEMQKAEAAAAAAKEAEERAAAEGVTSVADGEAKADSAEGEEAEESVPANGDEKIDTTPSEAANVPPATPQPMPLPKRSFFTPVEDAPSFAKRTVPQPPQQQQQQQERPAAVEQQPAPKEEAPAAFVPRMSGKRPGRK